MAINAAGEISVVIYTTGTLSDDSSTERLLSDLVFLFPEVQLYRKAGNKAMYLRAILRLILLCFDENKFGLSLVCSQSFTLVFVFFDFMIKSVLL